jgi:hypothetical protein
VTNQCRKKPDRGLGDILADTALPNTPLAGDGEKYQAATLGLARDIRGEMPVIRFKRTRAERDRKHRGGSSTALALILVTLALPGLMPGGAAASSPGYGGYPVTAQIITSVAAAPQGGFWGQLEDISPNFGQPPPRRDLAKAALPNSTISRARAALSLSPTCGGIGS